MRERDPYAGLPRGRWMEIGADEVSICNTVSILAIRGDIPSLVIRQVDSLDVGEVSNVLEQLSSDLLISIKHRSARPVSHPLGRSVLLRLPIVHPSAPNV